MRGTDIRFEASPREGEIRDLSPSSFRIILAILFGIGVLAVAGLL